MPLQWYKHLRQSLEEACRNARPQGVREPESEAAGSKGAGKRGREE